MMCTLGHIAIRGEKILTGFFQERNGTLKNVLIATEKVKEFQKIYHTENVCHVMELEKYNAASNQ